MSKKIVQVSASTNGLRKAHTRKIDTTHQWNVSSLNKNKKLNKNVLNPKFSSGEEAWAFCLTQDTGVFPMDSGKICSHRWKETNEKIMKSGVSPIEFFKQQPYIELHVNEKDDHIEYQKVSVNVFHLLTEKTSFDKELNTEFNVWYETENNKTLSYLSAVKKYVEETGWEETETIYTYNWQNELSHNIHWTEGTIPETGERKALVSIHTGADARSGFSIPVAINLDESEEFWFEETIDIFVTGPNEEKGYAKTSDHYIQWENNSNLLNKLPPTLSFIKETFNGSGGELAEHNKIFVHFDII